jgi:transposase
VIFGQRRRAVWRVSRAPGSHGGDQTSQQHQEPWCQSALPRWCAHARPGCCRPRCYPSDTSDAEWALIAPLLPVPAWQSGRDGRPEAHCRRAVIDAIRYVTHNGCVWRALPADFPPWRTVYGLYQRWNATGTTLALHDALRDRARAAAGRDAEPTAAVIDSQSVRAAPTVPKASRGWDNAKKVNGRKRHIAVDATGLLLEVLITPASTQDRDAARPLLFNLHRSRLAWADGGYAGKLQPWAATYLKLAVQIVRRPDDLHTFKVLPRRWVVERTLAWITSYRRCARDYERLPAHHEAMILWAMITLMTRRLARPG